jgi:hypothetical protein
LCLNLYRFVYQFGLTSYQRRFPRRSLSREERTFEKNRSPTIVVVIKNYYIVSYRIVSYRIVSYRIISYRIVSYRIVSYRIINLYRFVYQFSLTSYQRRLPYERLCQVYYTQAMPYQGRQYIRKKTSVCASGLCDRDSNVCMRVLDNVSRLRTCETNTQFEEGGCSQRLP